MGIRLQIHNGRVTKNPKPKTMVRILGILVTAEDGQNAGANANNKNRNTLREKMKCQILCPKLNH